jgi:hypothetical protein
LQLIWVPNQSAYITARDLDADTAKQIRTFLQQHAPKAADSTCSGDINGTVQQQPQQAGPWDYSWCQMIPYGATPALQQWMAEQQVM